MVLHSGVWAIAFTDMVGSTEQRARLGDASGDDLRREHDSIVAAVLARRRGVLVAGTGDGAMCAFESAVDAVAAAVELQQRVERRNGHANEPMRLRVGVSLGEFVHEDEGLMGIAAHEAARICALCEGGEVLVSDLVRAVARSRAECEFAPRGDFDLKGIPDAVTVWEVRWQAMSDPEALPLPALLGRSGIAALSGRQDELTRLRAVWQRAANGRRSAALLAGEPGIGKTRLAAEIGRLALDEGAVVLAGHCDAELGVPFQPFAEALESYLEQAPGEVIGRLTPELGILSSRLADGGPTSGEAAGGTSGSQQLRLFDAVASWISTLAEEQPVLLVVDDAHWATKPTLLMLRHLVLGRDDERVLVLVTYRDTDLDKGHPLRALLPELATLPGIERVALSGLGERDVVELLAELGEHEADGGEGALASALVDQTEGNPFFIQELLRHFAESGADLHDALGTGDRSLAVRGIPRGVREVLHQRLQHLGTDAADLLRAAAIVGREFSVDVVAAATGTDDDTAVRLLDQALGAHLVDDAGSDRYRFSHALVRAALEDEMSSSRRLRLHRRILEHLEHVRPTDITPLALHALAAATATEPGRAAEYAGRAGDAALTALASEEAADWYARGLAVLDDAPDADQEAVMEMLERLGEAQIAVGDPELYQPTWRRAADTALALGDERAHARMMLGYVGRSETLTDLDDYVRAGVERSLDRVEIDADAVRVRLMGVLASGITNFEPERATRLSSEALDVARSTGDSDLLLDAMRARLRCWWSPFELEGRRVLTEEMRELAAATRNADALAQSWQWSSIIAIESGDLGELAVAADEIERINDDLGLRYYHWATAARRTALALSFGALDDAERLMLEAQGLESHGFTVFPGQVMTLRWLQGRVRELDGLVPEAQAEPYRQGLLAVNALIATEADRRNEAQALLGDFAAGLDELARYDLIALSFAVIAGRAGVLAGRGSWLEPLASFLQRHNGLFAVVHPAAASLGAVDAVLGPLVALGGDRTEGEALLRHGIEQNRTAGLEPFLAIALADLAELLTQSDPRASQKTAADALDLGTRLGMHSVVQRASGLLQSPGEQPMSR